MVQKALILFLFYHIGKESAINTKTVTVTFTALTEDKQNVDLEVKNSKGEIVAVKPINLSKGDKEAQFTFETEQAETAFVGTWTISTVEYNFDAIAQLASIKTAVANNNIVELQKALKAAGITYLTETDAVLSKYKEDLAAANTASKLNTLTDVQTVITKANETLANSKNEAEKIKAVESATGQVSLLAALQANFKRVNEAWITQYVNNTNGFKFVTSNNVTTTQINKNGSAVVNPAVTDVQAAIDAVNLEQVSAVWDDAWNNADAKKLEAAKSLLGYVSEDTEDEKALKNQYVDEATRLAAVLNVFSVSASTDTNGTFEKAVKELDAVETTLVEKYKGTAKATNFSDELKIADFKSELLSTYRTELNKVTDNGKKNQSKDIQAVIEKVNGEHLNTLVTAVKDAAATYVAPADGDTDEQKATKAKNAKALLDAIKALVAYDSETFKNVVIKDSRVDAYDTAVAGLTTNTDIKAAIETANTTAGSAAVTAVADAATKLATTPATATTADVLKTLQSDELIVKNLIPANIEAYIAEDLTKKSASEALDAATLQTKIDKANAVVALNAATTAAEAKRAIAALNIENFTNVKTADKEYVAEQVLKARKDETDAKFATSTAVTTKVEAAITAYKAVLANFTAPAASTSAQITALKTLKDDAFDNHADQAAVAEYFALHFAKTATGTDVAYASLADVKEAVDAAIAAVK